MKEKQKSVGTAGDGIWNFEINYELADSIKEYIEYLWCWIPRQNTHRAKEAEPGAAFATMAFREFRHCALNATIVHDGELTSNSSIVSG